MTSAILDVIVRSTVLLTAAGTVAMLLRGRAASVQSFALTAALAASLALPVATWLLPTWDVPILAAVADVTPPLPPESGSADVLVLRVAAPAPANQGGAEATVGPVPSANRADTPNPVDLASVGGWALAAIWLAGTLAIVARSLASHVRLRRLVRRTRPMIDNRWDTAATSVSTEHGLRRPVTVRASTDIGVPIVTGVRTPIVIVPAAAETWPPAVVRDVLRHELAHVVRRDAWSQLAGRLACAAYWFNPLAWSLAARAAALRERACDDEVLRAGARASEYASRLIVLVGQCRDDGLGAAALAMASRSSIHQRIAHVLAPDVRRGRAGLPAIVMILLTASIVVPAVGLVQPVRAATSLALVSTATSADAIPAEAPQVASPSGMCAGRLRNSSNMTNSDDGRRRWRVRLNSAGCEVDLQMEGRVEFNEDFTDVARLDANGQFRLDATIDGTRRQLDIVSRNGSLDRTYRVAGREQAWDAAARAWFAEFLVALDRRTAIGVEVRLPHLLRQGGVAAVLAETGQMSSDHVRTRYYSGLLDTKQLTAAERRQLIDQAAALTESDHYASEVLERVVAEGRLEDPRERDAVVAMLKKMDSDHYRAQTVKVLAGGSLNADQAKAVLDVLTSMDSDHYRHEVLKRLVTAAPADFDLSLAASVIRAMESDHYQAESVKAIGRRRFESAQVSALLPIVASMDSDHYQAEVIRELLAVRVSEADLVATVDAIRQMDSDHYQADALGRVLANDGATDRVRTAVRDVASTLSRHYQQEVFRRIK